MTRKRASALTVLDANARPLKTVTMTLPLPTSTNRIWRNYGAGRTAKSAEYVAFLTEAQFIARSVTANWDAPMANDVELTLTIYLPNRNSDANNRIKAVEDAMNQIVYRDDKQIAVTHTYRQYDSANPRVLVTVTELASADYKPKTRKRAA